MDVMKQYSLFIADNYMERPQWHKPKGCLTRAAAPANEIVQPIRGQSYTFSHTVQLLRSILALVDSS